MAFDITGLGSVFDLASKVVGNIWPDKTQAEKDQMAQALALLQGQIAMNQGQMEINKVEAASPTLWNSGWRPFVGWVCASACAWNWVGLPIASFTATALHHPLNIAPADLTQMFPLLMGLLGMGALRTYEKTQGVARN